MKDFIIQGLALFSTRPADREFFQALARTQNWQYFNPTSVEGLLGLPFPMSEMVLVMNGDEQTEGEGSDFTEQGPMIIGAVEPNRVFILTDKSLNRYSEVYQQRFSDPHPYHNSLIRYYSPASMDIYARAIQGAGLTEPNGLYPFFSPDTKIQKIRLLEAKQRDAAIRAVQNLLTKSNLDPRSAAKAAQATDELLMNAIFDAPRDRAGGPLRLQLDRRSDFALNNRDEVTLELALCPNYVGICATDLYGAVNKESLLNYLGLSYRDKDYRAPKHTQGAGLGLCGVLESGLSLAIVYAAKARTDAMIFFPNVTNYRDFKRGFQFVICAP